jgi:hypothetical protein
VEPTAVILLYIAISKNESMKPPEHRLKDQHQLFVDAYAKTHNATQSAKDAGFSHKSASVQGYKLLQREDIKWAVALKTQPDLSPVAIPAQITDERVMLELWDKTDDSKPGRTHAASVSALRLIADIRGMTKSAGSNNGLASLKALTVRIRGADGSTVEVIQGSAKIPSLNAVNSISSDDSDQEEGVDYTESDQI